MGFDSIVSWLPGGTRFKVHDTEIFESLLTPRYFNQNYYKSFQRQLNIYGFERVRQGRHKGAYFHDLFVRGEPGLCHQMVRTKVRGRTSCKNKNSERPSLQRQRPRGKVEGSLVWSTSRSEQLFQEFDFTFSRNSQSQNECPTECQAEYHLGPLHHIEWPSAQEESARDCFSIAIISTKENDFEGGGFLSPFRLDSPLVSLSADDSRTLTSFFLSMEMLDAGGRDDFLV